MEKTNSHKLTQFGLLIFIVLSVFVVWSYIQTEVLSYTSNIDGNKICQTENLKYFKVTSFDGKTGQAQLLCIRSDQNQSTFHKLNLITSNYGREQDWEIIFTQKIYTDSNLFWPIYL